MEKISGFPAIANKKSRLLILGSMPGVKSLEQQQYYAHPSNVFWKIISELFNVELDADYESRLKTILKHRIALWDVVKSCQRPGSLDSSIIHSSIIMNDFKKFFIEHPMVQSVLFNGKKSEQLFRKYIFPELGKQQSLKLHGLPSTSPAHAGMTYRQKLDKWKIIKKVSG